MLDSWDGIEMNVSAAGEGKTNCEQAASLIRRSTAASYQAFH